MPNMAFFERSRVSADRRRTRRRACAGWASVVVCGLSAWSVMGQVAGPREGRGAEKVVFSLPNGERFEREIPRGSVTGVVVAKRRNERAVASADEWRGLTDHGPNEVMAGEVGRTATRSITRRLRSDRWAESPVQEPGALPVEEAAAETANRAIPEVLGWVPDRLGGGRYAESQPTRIPEKPTNVRAVDNGSGGVELSWVIASSNQSAFTIERQPPFSGDSTRYAAPGATVWVDESGVGTFVYTMRAVNEDARSALTDPVEVVVSSSALATPPVMIPGIGWAGVTPQPQAVGSPSERGYDAMAIARFDVVPYQSINEHIDVGVVAFHMNGIERVDFAVDGGPWTSVTRMSLNAQTGVWEYVSRVEGNQFTGGLIEVRAIAYPVVGEARVLPSLFLNVPTGGPSLTLYVSPTGNDTTGDGSDANPYRSICKAAKEIEIRQNGRADGGVINLKAGDHSWGPAGRDAEGRWISYPTTEERFLTIQTDPRIRKRDVRIVESPGGGIRTKLIHVRNVTVVGCQLENAQPPNSDRAVIWVHGCTFMGPSIVQAVRWVAPEAYLGGVYVTSTVVRDAVEGWTGATLVRGCTVDAIGNDAFVNCLMILNSEVRNIINPEGTGFHSDVLQYHTQQMPFENIIVYGLRAVNNTAQAWNMGYTRRGTGPAWSDIAFVNVLNEQDSNGYSSTWAASVDHLLWWNLTIPVGFVFLIDHPDVQDGVYFPTRLHNFSMKGCVLHKFNTTVTSGEPAISDPTWADNNHFIDVTSHGTMTAGTRFTTGGTPTELFVDPAAKDFTARESSVLCNREGVPLLPSDSVGRRTGMYRAVGAKQPLQP